MMSAHDWQMLGSAVVTTALLIASWMLPGDGK
jgi:hypothetical protein